MGGVQVFPESDDHATNKLTLLSFRAAHHVAKVRVAAGAVRRERAQATPGGGNTRAESST
jgi:hypothetical protein